MSLREEMWKYEQITGESAEHVPIIKVGAFLDGYEMGLKALEQEPILDKIRAEIKEEAEYAYADFDGYKNDVLHAESDELPDDDFRYGLERAVEIINKYNAESKIEQALSYADQDTLMSAT
jgi:hypothetical protein